MIIFIHSWAEGIALPKHFEHCTTLLGKELFLSMGYSILEVLMKKALLLSVYIKSVAEAYS
jgi:hypothetical protein